MTDEPEVVIDYPAFPWLVLMLLLMGVLWLKGLQVSVTTKERNVYLFALGMTALGVVFCWWYSVRTELRPKGIVIKRGIWPLRHVVSASYEDVGRIRVVDLNYKSVGSIVVAVNTGRWRSVQIAADMDYPPSGMRVRREEHLPDVEPREGEPNSSVKMRRIAKLLEERVAAARQRRAGV